MTFFRFLFPFLLACCFLTLGIAQDDDTDTKETEKPYTLYEAVVFPDRSLTRRLEQAARLFESGRNNEAAQLLGGILENADAVFLSPEITAGDAPIRTLYLTVHDYIINRIRDLPKEARESYAFQFEPTARRLLDNAVRTGSLDDVQLVARKYFPTASGASAALLVAFTQYERGDYAAAFLTLDRLKRLHPSLPDSVEPVLGQMHKELHEKLQNATAPTPQSISEPAWLEQIGWRLPTGSASQNADTQATAPLLEQNWTVPIFSWLFHERETDSISRSIENGRDVYIPAAQPLLVGNLFLTRTFGAIVAIDANTGKRLWTASEQEYRFPENSNYPPLPVSIYNLRIALRLFFWHNRVTQQLSSDGERLFCIDGHDFQEDPRQFVRVPNLAGKGDDPRYTPGNTLTARDMKTGRILWQIGKFPCVQKQLDALFANNSPAPRPTSGPQENIDETLFTDDEKILKETWFLGAPLPLHGRLYVVGETDGVLYLFVLESQTGRLIARQAVALAQSPMTADHVRRTYPLFPAASGGIVLCPTGNGLIAGLDATTLAPIWCFSYAREQTTGEANQRMRNRRPGFQIMNINDENFQRLFAESGWQVPCLMVDGQRVLVAPPDRAELYCLDLLSGKLLWTQPSSRFNALYVACIWENKVFVVTPNNLSVFDMDDGKEVTTHKISFPSSWKPVGVGVHSGQQYFIPFADGRLAVADLNGGRRLTWLDTSGAETSPPPQRNTQPQPQQQQQQQQGNRVQAWQGANVSDAFTSIMFTPDLVADNVFQRPTRFGNLVGIKGRFFSQSPTQITSFDQKEPLRQQAEALLKADPNDAQGLLQQGRLLKAEGKLTEAIDSFRASLKSNPTPEAADALRRNLLEAMRKDYPAWADAGQELETLAQFPDEWGMILYAQVEGILQSGTVSDLVPVLEKVFAFGHDPTILIPVGTDHSVQLHRALGDLIDQHLIKGNRPALREAWEELAETFLQRFMENPAGFPKPSHISALPLQWIQKTVYLPPDIQNWSMFTQIFRNTGAAEKAKEILRAQYKQYRLPVALDLQEKPATPEWLELSVPFVWNSKTVEVQDVPSAGSSTEPGQGNTPQGNLDRLLAVARNPDASRLVGNQLTLPILGELDPQLAAFNYILTPWAMGATDFFLCCNDMSGQEQWRLALPGVRYQDTRTVNATIGEHVLYIKGNKNLLLLVVGPSMTAIDVSPQTEAHVLWSKTLSSRLFCRQNSGSTGADQRLAAEQAFPQQSVFVSPHVVAVWDTKCVYGLDPLTGETIWVRKIPHDGCSILGDDENLFLVFSDIRRVVALDPTSGREFEEGSLPNGTAHYVYGTNIVFAIKNTEPDDYTLNVCDLRSIYDKRRRALQTPDTLPADTLPSERLHNRLNRDTTLIHMLHGDRFLSVANWGTKSLQIHDLLTHKTFLPDGNTALQFVSPEGVSTNKMRCDVSFVENRILVLFTKMPDLVRTTGARALTYNAIANMTGSAMGASINEGEMMLFDTDGKPCWAQPTKIETIYRLWDIPARLPVMLFAVSVLTKETVSTGVTHTYSTRIMGVDKRTGEFRFRKGLSTGNADRPYLQMCQVTADPATQEIFFTASSYSYPLERVMVRFTDEVE